MYTPGGGDPVPRYRRSPRRGYDKDGREIQPATVANVRQHGARGITARCACNHEGLIPFERLRPGEYVPDVALRVRCTACGGRQVTTYPDWSGGARVTIRPTLLR